MNRIRSTQGRKKVRAKLTVLAALAALAVTLATVAAARPVATRQRVAISNSETSSVVLPLTAGPIKPDTVTSSFCCWTERHMMRNGEAVVVDNPRMTLTGKRGTLVTRNRIAWVDIPGGSAVFTGTWKVIRGTGQYAGLSGGGREAGLKLANGNTTSRFQGFLSPK